MNNDWSTGDKMPRFFNKDPKCPMCDEQEDLKHAFSCNSPKAKRTRTECIHLVNMVLSKSDTEYSQWRCSMINGCFIVLGA